MHNVFLLVMRFWSLKLLCCCREYVGQFAYWRLIAVKGMSDLIAPGSCNAVAREDGGDGPSTDMGSLHRHCRTSRDGSRIPCGGAGEIQRVNWGFSRGLVFWPKLRPRLAPMGSPG
jgi:hypothetical protein